MKCFSVDEKSVTEGLSIIPSPFPHIGIGMKGPGRYSTRIGVSTKLATSLVVMPRQEETWCKHSRIESGCPRMKAKAGCSRDCSEREIQRKISYPSYAAVLECCVMRTANGGFLIVEPRRGDQRGLVHLKLHNGNIRHLSFFKMDAGLNNDLGTGHDAGHRNEPTFDFSHDMRHLIPVGSGKGVFILAEGGFGDVMPGKNECGKEFLLVMDPGSAVLAEKDYKSISMVAAIFDGRNVHAGSA